MSAKTPDQKGWAQWFESMGLTANQIRLIPFLAVLLAIGILFLQAEELFGVETGGSPEQPPGAVLVSGVPAEEEDELTRLERRYARDLEEKLSLIRGAGEVRVLLTLEAGPTIDVVKNTTIDQSTTTERAADDSTRQTQSSQTRSDHVFSRDGSSERPVIARTSRPEIAGVLIVAEGAHDTRVRAQLMDAAMVALRLPANRIEVVPADGGK